VYHLRTYGIRRTRALECRFIFLNDAFDVFTTLCGARRRTFFTRLARSIGLRNRNYGNRYDIVDGDSVFFFRPEGLVVFNIVVITVFAAQYDISCRVVAMRPTA